jgi:2-polyprenyl-3-methyl-5-hydroxy-6-metoxy-1,4-benzoquinol methylase
VADGHHRLSALYLNGNKSIMARVREEKLSYLQDLLLKVKQINGIELYQPVNKPEVLNWRLVRNCVDMWLLIKPFMRDFKIESAVDLACSYGWFVDQLKKDGVSALGVDKDQVALKVGKLVYGLEDEKLVCSDLFNFFDNEQEKFDLVLFLSILHHYGIKKEKGDLRKLLVNLDRMTKKVLILDSGENHEEWFKNLIPNWTPGYIEKMILDNTSFNKVKRLGKDTDSVPPYEKNYGRTLFAFWRE